MARFRRTLPLVHAFFVACMCVASGGCKSCEDEEEAEEREREQDHYWRVQIAIVGQGGVKTFISAFDCASDGTTQHGECGPQLVKFKELRPPTMQANPAAGWRFDHWESLIREFDSAAAPRKGPMPDGRIYINGFGYKDTGQLETVTAVFLPEVSAGDAAHHDGSAP